MLTFKRLLLAAALLLPLCTFSLALADDAGAPPDAAVMQVDAGAAAAAPAPVAKPKADFSDPMSALNEAVSDVKAKNWTAFAALLLMAVAFYAKKYAPSASFFKTFKGSLVLCIGAGLISAVGEALYGGHLDWGTLIAGLSATASAAFALAHPSPPAAK